MAEETVNMPTPPAGPPPRRDDNDDEVRRKEAEHDDDDASDENSRDGPSREDRTRLDDHGHGRRRRKSRSRDHGQRREKTPRREDRKEEQPDPRTGTVICGVCNMQVGGGYYMGTNPIARPASTTKPALSTPKDFLGRKRKLARRKNGPSGTAVPQCREPLPGKQWCCASGGPGHDDEDTEGDPKRRPQDEVDPRIVVGPGRRPEKPCQFLPGPK